MPPKLIRELTPTQQLCLSCPVPGGCRGIKSPACPRKQQKQTSKPRRPLLIQDSVLELLTDTGPLTANQVMENMAHASPRSIHSALLRLYKKGKLTRSPILGQRNRNIWLYAKGEVTTCATLTEDTRSTPASTGGPDQPGTTRQT